MAQSLSKGTQSDKKRRVQAQYREIDPVTNRLSKQVIGAAIEVHRNLGPGLLESAYETCLAYELRKSGIHVERQKALPIVYKEIKLDHGYRIDLLIENRLVVELKAVDWVTEIHKAQVLSYLKFSNCQLGLLLNFNATLLKHGIHRIIDTTL